MSRELSAKKYTVLKFDQETLLTDLLLALFCYRNWANKVDDTINHRIELLIRQMQAGAVSKLLSRKNGSISKEQKVD